MKEALSGEIRMEVRNWKIIFKHNALEIACLEKTWNGLKT